MEKNASRISISKLAKAVLSESRVAALLQCVYLAQNVFLSGSRKVPVLKRYQ